MEALNATIEEDIEEVLESVFDAVPFFMSIFRMEWLVSCLIGLCADGLIVYGILQSKRMLKSRTNLIVMNWAIVDGLFLILMLINYKLIFIREMFIEERSKILICVVSNSDVTIYYLFLIFMLLLTMNSVMKFASDKFVKYLIAIIYVISILFCIGSSSLCLVLKNYSLGYEQLVVSLLFIALAVNVILKQSWRCCRRRKPSKSSIQRLNIGSIFIINWTLSFVTVLLAHMMTPLFFLILFGIAGYLNSLCILIYLACSDINFKICYLKLFRLNADRYEVSAAISFAESCSEECDQAANVRFLNDERLEEDVFVV